MANTSGFTIKGIEELSQVLNGLSGKFGDQKVNEILRKAAAPMVREAKRLSSNADVTGETTKSIGIVANRSNNSITVGPRRGNGFKGYHAHLLEYGTAPHIIKAKAAGGLLRWAGGAAPQVQHPGSAAQPFMRPAFDATGTGMVESIKDQCREIIESGFKSVYK
ncbi:HK97 gp10 family phage protein [Microvirga sp. STS02]|uniref:HK97-gp10 family putative phage morphogenesis protein n=1 Tax=Hymenobacter negativus TaxID=2795026 RepID=UPI0018DC6640|nr:MULTISPECIES: HK97-gp10 family putative phage morphogenesis protein [Bacteria]MBH8569359.1 HK97 gp10 family phage protein [Hymenobacter negativus]MBR7209093.1 HK97 gp10 family phage protein [Microvirga sp. STS02]